MASWPLSKIKPKFKFWLVIFILGLATFLRLLNFASNPPALNRDEASIGYTTLALLKTGKDEHEISWPLNYQSFGDWKLLGYPIFDLPFVAIFGLSDLTVRLPSILAGSLLVGLVFLLVKNLQTNFLPSNRSLALLTVGLLALNPWAIHLSRLAYEANLALFFFTSAVVLFLLSLKRKPWFLLLSSLLFVLTLFTYHSYQVFTPLMLVALLIIYRQQLFVFCRKQKMIFSLSLAIFFLGLIMIFLTGTQNSNQIKFSGLSVFSSDLYKDEIFANRNYLSTQPRLITRLYANRPVLIFRKLASNFFQALNADFLFFNGGGHGAHDTKSLGKLFLFQTPLLILGLWSLLGQKSALKSQAKALFIVWFLVSLVAPVVTLQPAHSTRFSPSIVPFAVFSALGLIYLLESLKHWPKVLKSVTLVVLLGLVSLELFRAFVTYYLVAPIRDIDNWDWYAKPMVEKINQLEPNYQEIYLAGKTWSPYIYFLFYNQPNPQKLWCGELVYDLVDPEGFQHVNQLGKLHFGQIPWDLLTQTDTKRLFIIKQTELPTDKGGLLNSKLVYTLTRQGANVTWYFIEN